MTHRTAGNAALSALLVLGAAACTRPLPVLAPSQVPEPPASDVESVIYLVGDVGYADENRNPIVRRMRNDIEDWSAALGRDSAVAVVFLGDIVYPVGLRHTEEHFARDSAIVQSQVNMLAGPNARRHRAAGFFLAGNHDWGNARDETGVQRLRNLEEFLDRRRVEGVSVYLRPAAGKPGPTVVDVGDQTRLLLLDTAWWLLAQDTVLKQQMFRETHEATRTAGSRFLIVAAHHPFRSAGAHAGFIPFWKAFGLRMLLARSGSMMQDLNSLVYRELRRELLDAFRSRPPLIFAGGHDHSLQVIASDTFPQPRYNVVSGSGSKLSTLGHTEGMRYRAAAPGYMRVVIHHSGRVDLFVIASPEDDAYLVCGDAGAALEACMAARTSEFITRFGMRLK
ncbi:MAG: metallophosphoesterase [Gemmatimonadetes bacterium]|nr:metallophosphoesterase [Gemmatimonadota bacterium]